MHTRRLAPAIATRFRHTERTDPSGPVLSFPPHSLPLPTPFRSPLPSAPHSLPLPTPFRSPLPTHLVTFPCCPPCHSPLAALTPGSAIACFPAADGQKPLFCPTEGCFPCHGWAKTPVLPNGALFFLPWMGKNPCFAQRSAVFPAADVQKPLFCPTKARLSGFGIPKWLFLGYRGEFF